MPTAQSFACVADRGQIQLPNGSASALTSLPNPLTLDLLQILGEGGNVLIRVSSTGVVTQNSLSATSKCLYGPYFSRLTSSATVAQVFADAFSQNNDQQDILQVRGQGGNGVYHLDYLGVARSS